MLFKLLAGLYVCDDKSKPILDAEGKPTGKFKDKTYTAGQVVESDIDLADRHGHQKFQPLQGDTQNISRTAGDKSPGANPTSFPGGQVASGFQETTSPVRDPETGVTAQSSGPASDEVRKKLEAAESKSNEEKTGKQPAQNAIKATPAQLDGMSQKDLKEYAEDREIDLRGAKTRDEILKVIKTTK